MATTKVNQQDNNLQPVRALRGAMNPNGQKAKGMPAGKAGGMKSVNNQKNNKQKPGMLGRGNVNEQSNNLQKQTAKGTGIGKVNAQSNNRVRPMKAKGIMKGNPNGQGTKNTIESVGSGQRGTGKPYSELF